MFRRIAFFLVFLAFSAALHAAQPKEALLIANGKYSHFAGLAHPSPDAAKLSAALEQLGFRVRVVRDGNREEMLDAISEFEHGLRNTGAIAFFHYGGHGVQVDGKNYLLPADADIPDERRVSTRAVALDEVMTAMDAAAARASIIVIDACRDNPLPAGSGRNLARGLSVVGMKPKNSMVIYAAEAGSKALDGLFTPILASSLQQKGRSINQIMMSVRSEVYAKSSGQQTPGEYNQLFEELFLGELGGGDLSADKVFAAKPAPTPYATPTPASGVKDDMVRVEGGTLPDASELAGKTVKSFYIGRTEVIWLEWKKVRNWAADNGYDIGNVGAGSGNDHPVRDVSWYDCLKWCNAKSEMEGLEPVYEVEGTVYRNKEYSEGSNVITQRVSANGYRLPNEAEWEWAARGGVRSRGYKYSGSDDLNVAAWYRGNSMGAEDDLGKAMLSKFPNFYKSWSAEQKAMLAKCGTFSVALKAISELDLCDMTGNVWEWCWDINGSYRRLRGGSWGDSAEDCAVSYRNDGYPGLRNPNLGLRLARSLSAHDDMVLVEGGTLPDESNLAGKSVQSFYIGRTEVTWLEWKKVKNWAADNGYDIGKVGEGSGNDHPVEGVSWYDCVKWCNAKSEIVGLKPVYQVKGKIYRNQTDAYGPPGQIRVIVNPLEVDMIAGADGYRLPTELEWEWAARGGMKSRGYKYSGSNDLNAVGWFRGNSKVAVKGATFDLGESSRPDFLDKWTKEEKMECAGCGSWPVAKKAPNELKIFDMSGNVSEWCWDQLDGERVIRGGSWRKIANDCANYYSGATIPDFGFGSFGFRLARSSENRN